MDKILSAVAAILTLSVTSCDDGRIYDILPGNSDDEGFSVEYSGHVSGIDEWPEGYSLVVAGFADSDFAVITKTVTSCDDAFTLSGIPVEVTTVELCVVNNLRRRIASYASVQTSENENRLIRFDAGDIDAGMFATIQDVIFTTSCSQCHGGSSHAAAGLYLTAGESYAALVNMPSAVMPDHMRVQPGDAASSSLWMAVATDISVNWSFDHSGLLNSSQSDLIRNWIDFGAKNSDL